MKKIIAGKRYDTEKAEKIADWTNGLNGSDFNFIRETLYRTKKGNWFLEYVGGANTHYANKFNGYSSGSTGILPILDDKVLEWLEERSETDAMEKYFKDGIEDA